MTYKVGDRVVVNNSLFNEMGVLSEESRGTVSGVVKDDGNLLFVELDDGNPIINGSPLPVMASEIQLLEE